jgi:CHAT domain-containing protein
MALAAPTAATAQWQTGGKIGALLLQGAVDDAWPEQEARAREALLKAEEKGTPTKDLVERLAKLVEVLELRAEAFEKDGKTDNARLLLTELSNLKVRQNAVEKAWIESLPIPQRWEEEAELFRQRKAVGDRADVLQRLVDHYVGSNAPAERIYEAASALSEHYSTEAIADAAAAPLALKFTELAIDSGRRAGEVPPPVMIEHLFLRAGLLAVMAREAEAEQHFATAVEAWRRQMAALALQVKRRDEDDPYDDSPEQLESLARRPFEHLSSLELHLDSRPSFVLAAAKILDNSTIAEHLDPERVARALTTAGTDRQRPSYHRRLAQLAIAAIAKQPEKLSDVVGDALRALPADHRIAFLDELSGLVDARSDARAAIRGAQIKAILDADSRNYERGDFSLWWELAGAQLAAGDFQSARRLLAQAPAELRLTMAVSIAEATKAAEDAAVAIGMLESAVDLEDRISAIESLAIAAIEQPEIGDWRTIVARVEPSERWRLADTFAQGGDMASAIELLRSTPSDKIVTMLNGVTRVAAQEGQEASGASLGRLRDFAGTIEDPLARMDALVSIGRQTRERSRPIALGAAAKALEAGKAASAKICTADKCEDGGAFERLARLQAELGQLDQALRVVDLVPPGLRGELLVDIADAGAATLTRPQLRDLYKRARSTVVEGFFEHARLLSNIALGQAEHGFVDEALDTSLFEISLRNHRIQQRRPQELEQAISLLVIGGEVQRAEALLERIEDPLDRARSEARVAGGWLKLGDEQRFQAAVKRLLAAIRNVAAGDRDDAASDARSYVVEPLAKKGRLDALELLVKIGGSRRDLAYLVGDFPEAVRKGLGPAAISFARKLRQAKTDRGRMDDTIYTALRLAEAGAGPQALSLLAEVEWANLPPAETAASRDALRKQLDPALAGLQERAGQLHPELAGDLANTLVEMDEEAASFGEPFQRRLLNLVETLAFRGLSADRNRRAAEALASVREKRSAAAKTPIDANATALKQLAALDAQPEAATAYGSYFAIARTAAFNKVALPAALEAVRRATSAHRGHLTKLLSTGATLSRLEQEVRSSSGRYFGHIALLHDLLSRGGGTSDKKALIAEAFRVAQYMSFDPLLAETLLSDASQTRLRRLEVQLALGERRADQPPKALDTLRRQIGSMYAKAPAALDKMEVPLERVQTALGPKDALLLYIGPDQVVGLETLSSASSVLGNDAMMLVVRRDRAELVSLGQAPTFVSDEIKAFMANVSRWANAARAGIAVDARVRAEPVGTTFDVAGAYRLYRTLIHPATPHLEGVDRLLIPSRNALGLLPLHMLVSALPDSSLELRSVPWLARKFSINLIPSAASLAVGTSGANRSLSRPFVGFGNPILSKAMAAPANVSLLDGLNRTDTKGLASLTSLPETVEELRLTSQALNGPEVSETADCLVCVGDASTEGRFRGLSSSGGLKGLGVLSLATHGLVAGDLNGLVESALVFTPGSADSLDDDGLLTASEIAALDIEAQLVLLSACNTAVGGTGINKTGVSDLASAFLLAGSDSVLVSHWPVNSQATAHLISRAANHFAKAPQGGFDQALRTAMLEMIDGSADPRWSHPYYWAPFNLVRARNLTSAN